MKRREVIACLLAGLALRGRLPVEQALGLYLAALMALQYLVRRRLAADPEGLSHRLRGLASLRLVWLGALAGTWGGDWLALPGLPVYALLAAAAAFLPLAPAGAEGSVWSYRRQLQQAFVRESRLTLAVVVGIAFVRPTLTCWVATQAAAVLLLSLPWAAILWLSLGGRRARRRPETRLSKLGRSLCRVAAATLIGSLPLVVLCTPWNPVWYSLTTFALVLLGSPWRTPGRRGAWQAAPPSPATPENAHSVAAILLMSMPPEVSAQLFLEIGPKAVHQITLTISKLNAIHPEQRANLFAGFLRCAEWHHQRAGGQARLEVAEDYEGLVRDSRTEAGRLFRLVCLLGGDEPPPVVSQDPSPRPRPPRRAELPRPPVWAGPALVAGLTLSVALMTLALQSSCPVLSVREAFSPSPLEVQRAGLQRWLDQTLGRGRAGVAWTADGCVVSLTGDATLAADLNPALRAQLGPTTRLLVVPTAEPPTRDFTWPVLLTALAALLTGAARRPGHVEVPEQPELVLPPSSPRPLLALELGRGVRALGAGEPLKARIQALRRHLVRELGITLPPVHISPNDLLASNLYVVKVRGAELGTGQLQAGQLMAIGPEEKLTSLRGTKTIDPTYGMPCIHISPDQRGDAERLGCLLFDQVSVLATHLTEIVRAHAAELLGLQELEDLLGHHLTAQPALRHALEAVGRVNLRAVLRLLLEEGVSVRDLPGILERLAEHTVRPGLVTLEARVADVRLFLRHTICQPLLRPDRVLCVMNFECSLDHLGCMEALAGAIQAVQEYGYPPILVCPDRCRFALSQRARRWSPLLTVLAQSEVDASYDVRVLRVVRCSRD